MNEGRSDGGVNTTRESAYDMLAIGNLQLETNEEIKFPEWLSMEEKKNVLVAVIKQQLRRREKKN